MCSPDQIIKNGNCTAFPTGHVPDIDKQVCSSSGRNLEIEVRFRIKGKPRFPPNITYWFLDPAGNGSYIKCNEFDFNEKFECPIDQDLSKHARPVIIKKHVEIRTEKCVSFPGFHNCSIEESYFLYRYIPPQLQCVNCHTTDPFKPVFPMWGQMLIIILCISLIFVAIFIVYIFYNKRQNLLTLQPQNFKLTP